VAPEPPKRITQQEFESGRTALRRNIFIAAVADIGVAVLALVVNAPIVAGALVLVAVVGAPLLLRWLDRNWQQQGYEIP
jgi:Flp pilus assembly protein TadB